MSKIRILSSLVIILVTINIVLVGILMKQNHGPINHKGPRNEIISKLHLDEGQVESYDVLIEKHRTDVKNTQGQIRELKNNLYSQLKSSSNGNNQDSIIQLIGQKQIEIEQIHLSHFRALQRICTIDQQKNFDQLSSEIAHLFSPHPFDNKR